MENMSPCNPLAKIRILSPRPINTANPSLSRTRLTTRRYDTTSEKVCLVVLMTRYKFETVSDTTLAATLMKAFLFLNVLSAGAGGKCSWRKLKVKNHGKLADYPILLGIILVDVAKEQYCKHLHFN